MRGLWTRTSSSHRVSLPLLPTMMWNPFSSCVCSNRWVIKGSLAPELIIEFAPEFDTDTAPEDRDFLLTCGLCRGELVLRGPSYDVRELRREHALECEPISDEGSSEATADEEHGTDEESEADKENRG